MPERRSCIYRSACNNAKLSCPNHVVVVASRPDSQQYLTDSGRATIQAPALLMLTTVATLCDLVNNS